jgi:hypothetical protein
MVAAAKTAQKSKKEGTPIKRSKPSHAQLAGGSAFACDSPAGRGAMRGSAVRAAPAAGACARVRIAPRRRALRAAQAGARAAAGGGAVTILYRTEWEHCQLHYSVNGGAAASRAPHALHPALRIASCA